MALCRHFSHLSGTAWGLKAFRRSIEPWKSAVSAGERATGPRWYSGVRDTVWGLGLFSRAAGNAAVKRSGTWWSERRVLPQ